MPNDQTDKHWLPSDARKDIEYGRATVAPGVEVRGVNMFADPQQVGGDHYTRLVPSLFEVIRSWNIPHAEAEAIYHIVRHREKAGAEDLRKAIHYLQMIIDHDYTAAASHSQEDATP